MRTTMAAAAPWPLALAVNRAGATGDSVTKPVAPATWKVAGPVALWLLITLFPVPAGLTPAAWHYFGSMFGLMPVADTAPLLAAAIYTPYRLLILAICAGLVFQPLQAHDWAQRPMAWPRLALATPLFILALITMYSQAFNPFLYFQF